MNNKNKGWRRESDRHALASKGIKTRFEKMKTYEKPTKDFLDVIEEIKISKDDMWDAFKRNEYVREHGGTKHDVRLYPPFKEKMKGELVWHQSGGFYPDELYPKPIHISFDKFLDEDKLRVGYFDEMKESEEVFEEEMELEGVKEGTSEYEKRKDEWLNEFEFFYQQKFYDALKEEIEIDDYYNEDVKTIKIDWEK